jgi:glycyl-tRNA synthetase beta chain
VLTTTLIHHQHYFPVESEDGKLKNAFLAVINTEPDSERTIARNAERVVTARLRDARFFWEADRRLSLESRIDRLATLLFHKKLGTYKEKAERIERLAAWIAREAFGADEATAGHAAKAARLAKADLTTDMVREFTELQGTMGGIYAREERLPEEVWKAIYFHYLPVGVEADAPPTKAQLGKAAVTWAAVSLADKLDTVVGLFAAGEKPTGSRDPYGLRRAAQGVMKVLVDCEQLTGTSKRPVLGPMLLQARNAFTDSALTHAEMNPIREFFIDRLRHLMQSRGLEHQEIQAITARINVIDTESPADLLDRANEIKRVQTTPVFASVAEAYKRAKNIVGQAWGGKDEHPRGHNSSRLVEPAEVALRTALDRVGHDIRAALDARRPSKALTAIASIEPELARFFSEVRVMVEDDELQDARLALLAELRDRIEEFGDISAVVQKPA